MKKVQNYRFKRQKITFKNFNALCAKHNSLYIIIMLTFKRFFGSTLIFSSGTSLSMLILDGPIGLGVESFITSPMEWTPTTEPDLTGEELQAREKYLTVTHPFLSESILSPTLTL